MKIKPDTYYWAIYECLLVIIKTSCKNPNYFFAIGQNIELDISCAIILKEVSKEEVEQAERLADLYIAAANGFKEEK